VIDLLVSTLVNVSVGPGDPEQPDGVAGVVGEITVGTEPGHPVRN
jgi:hypothetical protein